VVLVAFFIRFSFPTFATNRWDGRNELERC
jgi:hypothetical protein